MKLWCHILSQGNYEEKRVLFLYFIPYPFLQNNTEARLYIIHSYLICISQTKFYLGLFNLLDGQFLPFSKKIISTSTKVDITFGGRGSPTLKRGALGMYTNIPGKIQHISKSLTIYDVYQIYYEFS